ncbi:probable 28S rRNA (cytosine-C(5))-methyltransferase isoform X2 [Mizuhopecten yessoensis]|uniref:probable 28S rRNA (cytosine-C(5))-methyltransferase isoform X2 n=1 Tax=Mizuhopecten yessoensis TaxID=6573 RepID=UPI000B45D9E3|nr:probable 28S rRNA (cytosine-C(5))-methyltransferase isoform X2 [Mizuhopecten yessoensis]
MAKRPDDVGRNQDRCITESLVDIENKPQLIGLVCETLKYGALLQQLVDRTKLLTKEHLLKGDNLLAQTLVHDFVVGRGINHAGRLKQVITRNRAALTKKYESMLADAGVTSLEQLLPQNETSFAGTLPRYVRVNLLKSSVSDVISTLESEGWERSVTPAKDIQGFQDAVSNLQDYHFLQDPHLHDVLVFPPRTDFHENELLTSGKIVLQDRASCFPAHILSPPEGATIFDCCAAPGNKTSHVASLINNKGTVFALDKDGRRMATLQRLMRNVGVTCVIPNCQDFLKVNPQDARYKDVEYMLVDPSCSGSGIVSRMNEIIDDPSTSSSQRLDTLSNFQVTMLKHAMKFPNVKRVVYSTCSIHAEENEEVISELETIVEGQFKVCKVFPDWPDRGLPGYDSSDCFLRMSPENSLSNGFFVACFERVETNPDVNRTVPKHAKKKKKMREKDESEISSEQETCSNDIETTDTTVVSKKKKCKKSNDSDEETFIEENGTKKRKHGEKESEPESKRKRKKHGMNLVENPDCVDTDGNDDVCANGDLSLNVDACDENIEEENGVSVKKHKKKKKHKNRDLEMKSCSLGNHFEAGETGEEDKSNVIKKHKKKHKNRDLEMSTCSVDDHCVAADIEEKVVKKHKKKHKHRDLEMNTCSVDDNFEAAEIEDHSNVETTETSEEHVSHHKKKRKHKHNKD